LENIVTIRGCKFEIRNPKDHIQKHWKQGSFYESNKNGLLSYLLRNKYSGRCLDIGANVGNHTIFFDKILKCEVVAIEPDLDSFSHLKKNCELNNSKSEILNFAVGESSGHCSMKLNDKNNTGMNTVTEGNDIRIERLDSLVSGQFQFIKIDVEGFNAQVLKGAENTFKSQKKCHIFIECEDTKTLQETDFLMSKYGYTKQNVKLNHTPTYLWIK